MLYHTFFLVNIMVGQSRSALSNLQRFENDVENGRISPTL